MVVAKVVTCMTCFAVLGFIGLFLASNTTAMPAAEPPELARPTLQCRIHLPCAANCNDSHANTLLVKHIPKKLCETIRNSGVQFRIKHWVGHHGSMSKARLTNACCYPCLDPRHQLSSSCQQARYTRSCFLRVGCRSLCSPLSAQLKCLQLLPTSCKLSKQTEDRWAFNLVSGPVCSKFLCLCLCL